MRVAKRWLTAALAAGLSLLAVGCSGVVARVNGEDISRKDFVEALERAGGAGTLQTMVLHRLMFERAQAEGLTPTAEDIQAELKKVKEGEPFGGDEAKWAEYLKQEGTDDTVILDKIKLDLTVFRLRTSHLKPDEATLKAFFEEYRERLFDKPARVTLKQIVVASPQVANEVITRLNTEEAIFDQLANQYSLDANTKGRGGLLEDAPLALLQEQAKPVYDAVMKLKPNQVTQQPVVLVNQNGQQAYVIVKLIARKPVEPAQYEPIKDEVKQAFLMANAKPEQELITELLKGSNVVILDSRYKELLEPRFAGAATGVPPQLQEQLSQPPEMTSPTRIRPGEMPAPTMPGDAAAAGGN